MIIEVRATSKFGHIWQANWMRQDRQPRHYAGVAGWSVSYVRGRQRATSPVQLSHGGLPGPVAFRSGT